MVTMGVKYTTREAVKSATDMAETARANTRVDDAIESASRTIDRAMRRTFYPTSGTRTLDWPPPQRSRSWVLWLDEHELISATTVVAGGVTIASGDYLLRPDDGPPYNRIEIDLGSSAAWASGDTHQRAISITGVFGYAADERSAGALAEGLDDAEPAVDVTDSAAIGAGDLIRVDSERMIVTGKAMLSTGQTLQTPLTAATTAQTVAVSSGAGYAVGETILLDAERMLITDIAGNSLTVQRAYDGSTLAAHTGSTIYAPRTLTVERGAVGTTAATHLTAASLYRHRPPGPISTLCRALAITELQQDGAGWSRTSGSGDRAKDAGGTGLAEAWANAKPYRRRWLGGAV